MTLGHGQKGVVLLISVLAAFLIPFMGAAVNIALPTIGREFNMNAVSLSWVATSYLLATCVLLLPFGRLSDIAGRRGIFVFGSILYTVASLLCGVAASEVQIISFRVVQGIGAAMIFSTAMALLASMFSKEERGRVFGINAASVYLGLSIGPTAGGLLTHYLGWRSIFLVNIPLGLVMIYLTAVKLKKDVPEKAGEKFDIIGSTIYVISMFSLMIGFSGVTNISSLWLIVSGIVGFVVFIRLESSMKFPVLNVRLFRENIVFRYSSMATLINYSATFAVGFLLSLYLQYIRDMSTVKAGLFLAIQPVVMSISSPFAGSLSDRIEPRIVASIGMALTFLGLLPFVFLDGSTSLTLIFIFLIVVGLGFGLFSSPNTNSIMGASPRHEYGIASAIIGTMRLSGQTLSMAIVTIIFAVMLGPVAIARENYLSFIASVKIAFGIFAALCFCGIFFSIARGKKSNKGFPSAITQNFRKGVLMGVPIVVGYVAVGIPFGILAAKAGLPIWAVALMCLLVVAGAAQFIAIQLISVGTGFAPIILATFIVNLRHFLMTTSLGGALPRLNIPVLAYFAHTTTDETYGINISKTSCGADLEPMSVFGTNLMAHLSWTLSSILGAYIGNMIPVRIDYLSGALPIMFAMLLALQLKKPYHYILVLATIVLTLVFMRFIPGQWPFLVVALVVPTVATVFDEWRRA